MGLCGFMCRMKRMSSKACRRKKNRRRTLMKYEYSFETMHLKDGTPFIILRLPPHLEMITSFLFTEVDTRESSGYIFPHWKM